MRHMNLVTARATVTPDNSDYKEIFLLKELCEVIKFESKISESSKKYLLNNLQYNENIIHK